jgi:hypothetical protein
MHMHTIQYWKHLRATIKRKCPNFLQKMFYFYMTLLSHTMPIQLCNTCCASRGKSWNNWHTTPIWQHATTISNLVYRITLAFTHFKIMTTWRQLWCGGSNCRTHTLLLTGNWKARFCNMTNSSTVVTMLKSKLAVMILHVHYFLLELEINSSQYDLWLITDTEKYKKWSNEC